VESVGGQLVGSYRDPLGREPVLVAILPIESVEPTPFQRDLSQAHHRRLADVLDRTGMFLDPIIAVTAPEKGFWTPNGMHRLMAMRRLGARAITALVVPKREIAWQILALNTEKAHNLREKSLEVIRIYRGLIDEDPKRPETQFAYYLEEASFVTMGMCYERNGKFAGGACSPVVRRRTFSEDSLAKAVKVHERHADMLTDLDERVAAVIAKLKAAASEPLPAGLRHRAHQSAALDAGRAAAARGRAEDDARARRQVQHRESEAAGPGERRRCAR
jgi:ParB family chromosome partitioning protein